MGTRPKPRDLFPDAQRQSGRKMTDTTSLRDQSQPASDSLTHKATAVASSVANAGQQRLDAAIEGTAPDTMWKIIKLAFIVNAGILMFAGVWGLIFSAEGFLDRLLALFVIGFASLMLAHELEISKQGLHTKIREYFGFLANLYGRALFVILVGCMSLNLKAFGYLSFPVSLVNGVLNLYILVKFPAARANPRIGNDPQPNGGQGTTQGDIPLNDMANP